LISKGVVPGPIMFQQQGDFVLTVFIGLLLINLFLLIVGLIGTNTFSLVSRVPLRILGPFVLLLIVAGAYAYANYSAHIVMVLVLAAIAYLLEKINIPVVPIVLAFIMGPIIESNLNRALTITRGDIFEIVTRPITATILVLAVITAVYSFLSNLRQTRREAALHQQQADT
jgi:putative tricarboxylic transport membrane protein